jgi:hypothetical protein
MPFDPSRFMPEEPKKSGFDPSRFMPKTPEIPIPDIASPTEVARIDQVTANIAKAKEHEEHRQKIEAISQQLVTPDVEVYHPKPRDILKEKPFITGGKAQAPAIPVEAKATPVASTKKLLEFVQAIPDGQVSAVAITDQQKRSREVFDAFDGDKNALHAKLRTLAKEQKKSAKWVSKTFNTIINQAEALPEGAKVREDDLKVKIPKIELTPGTGIDTEVTVSPKSVLEGGLQQIAATGGDGLEITKGREKVGKTAKVVGDIVEIGAGVLSTGALGKTLASTAKSGILKKAGQLLANPDTNPIPDAAYAALNEGDFSKKFVEGYAINLALGRLMGGKGALKLVKDLPVKDRSQIRGTIAELNKGFDKFKTAKERTAMMKRLGITEKELTQFEGAVNLRKQTELKNANKEELNVLLKSARRDLNYEQRVTNNADVIKDVEADIAEIQKLQSINKREVTEANKALSTAEKEISPKLQKQELLTDIVKKPKVVKDDVTQENVKRSIFKSRAKDKGIVQNPAYDRARKAVRNINRPTLTSIRKAFTRNVVDVSGNLKKELRTHGEQGQKVVDKMKQALGASGKAKVRHEQALDDILSDIHTDREKELLSDYIDARRTLFLDDNKKAVGDRDGLSPHQIRKDLKRFAKEHPELDKRRRAAGDKYFAQMNKLLDDRLEAGLIDKTLHKELSGNIYSPRIWIQHLEKTDGNIASTLGEAESGIKGLKDGSDTELVNDLEFLLGKSITNAERQIASNNAGKAMYDLMKTGEAEGMFVELKPLFGKNKNIKGYTKPPRGYEPVSVMIDGKKVQYGIRTDMAEEFILKDPILSPQVSKWLRIVSGNNILKFNATQASTDFPLANVFRDIGTIMFANKEYSNFIPLASAELAGDLRKVWADAVKRKGRYLDYVNEGGSMDFLMATADTWSPQAKSKLAPAVKGVFDALRYVGETSEALTRLALRERALKNILKQNPKMPLAEAQVKATLASRRYMDFGQGGRVVKALDSVMPYFNAGIQGHRAWMRGAKNDPVGFTSKVFQVGSASAALATYNIVNNPEAWDSVPDRIKSSNWVITTSEYDLDDDGIKKYRYFTIPKPPGISTAFSVFEASAEAAQGRDVPYKQILQGIDDFMGLGSVPPLAGAALAIVGNVDSYTWEQIYKSGDSPRREEEITKTTPEWAIRAGKITGQSPERIRTAKSKYFTYRNGWYDMSAATIDAVYSGITGKEMSEQTDKITDFDGMPGLRRFVRKTSGEVPREKLGDAMREFRTKRKIQKREMDKIIESLPEKEFTPSRPKVINDYINKQPEESRNALRQRYANLSHHKDIPRHFININYIAQGSPEDKAKAMYDEWAKADEQGKKDIDGYIKRIKGMGSRRFNKMYNFYKDEAKRN